MEKDEKYQESMKKHYFCCIAEVTCIIKQVLHLLRPAHKEWRTTRVKWSVTIVTPLVTNATCIFPTSEQKQKQKQLCWELVFGPLSHVSFPCSGDCSSSLGIMVTLRAYKYISSWDWKWALFFFNILVFSFNFSHFPLQLSFPLQFLKPVLSLFLVIFPSAISFCSLPSKEIIIHI